MTRSMIVTDYGEHDVSPKFEVLLAYAPNFGCGNLGSIPSGASPLTFPLTVSYNPRARIARLRFL